MKKISLDNLLDETHKFADFHDSTITKIEVDYVSRSAKLTFELNIGNIEIESEKRGNGILSFDYLQFFVAQPPDGQHNFENSSGLTVAGDGALQDTEFKQSLPELPVVDEDAFVHWFYIVEWNSFIFVSAKKAAFFWN